MLVSKETGLRCEHPTEEGVIAWVRTPTWGQYLVLSEWAESRDSGINNVLAQCVVRWTYTDEKVSQEDIADLDFASLSWLLLEAVKLGTANQNPGEDEEPSPGSPSPSILTLSAEGDSPTDSEISSSASG